MFFLFLFYLKKWVIHSFPHFWWAMWANHSGHSPKMSFVSESLRLLTKNERPWVIRSGRTFFCRAGNLLICSSLIRSFCSNQMSDCERFAQITQDKWATVSKLLRPLRGNEDSERIIQVTQDKWATISDSLRGNEQMSDSLKKCWLKKSKILFLVGFIYNFFYWKNEQITHFLFFGERCEWIAQATH